jgi:hypothetical protein
MVDVINARYIKEYLIEVEFSDSKKGIINFKEYALREGLFRDLTDIGFFRRFEVNKDIGTICWPNGLDIAPETLYSKIS